MKDKHKKPVEHDQSATGGQRLMPESEELRGSSGSFGIEGATNEALPVVNSFNGWDPLEEVIVGILDGAVELCWEPGVESVMPVEQVEELKAWHRERGGQPFFDQQLAPARKELDEFMHILRAEGVTVRLPDPQPKPHPTKSKDIRKPAEMLAFSFLRLPRRSNDFR
ncbi:MAG: hypothetical protein AB7T38_08080 [Nitrospirales bacterium]